MATQVFLSSAKPFNPILLSSSFPTSPSSSSSSLNVRPELIICKAANDSAPSAPILTKRSLSICLTTTLLSSIASGFGYSPANAFILEADDDVELLEKVKKDRKRRLERQGVISSSAKEKAYIQEVVYRLSKIGQAIEKNDLPAASSVFGQSSSNIDWVQKANVAFTKFSDNDEEKTEVDTFNTSLASLISSVGNNDVESSKLAFVSSAAAFEKWTNLTGISEQIKGL